MKKKSSLSPQEPKLPALRPGGRKHLSRAAGTEVPAIVDEAALLTDLRELIQSARQRIATLASSTTTLLYWHLGRRLLAENLQDGRAAYGERILATVSRELTAEFGGGFGYATVNRAIQFAKFFENLQNEQAQYGKRILVTVSRELTGALGQGLYLRSLYLVIQGLRDQEIVSTLSTQSRSHPEALQPGRSSMNTYEVTSEAILSLARNVQDLEQRAAWQYKPVVDRILHTRSSDIQHIKQTLDSLLDFCGYAPVLEMYKQLCRHYWNIDPAATAYYIKAYREYWCDDKQAGQP